MTTEALSGKSKIKEQFSDQSAASLDKVSFFPALKAAYDLILNIDLNSDLVSFVHAVESINIGPIYEVEMSTSSACDFWINNYIDPSFAESVRKYLHNIQISDPSIAEGITFDIKWTDNKTHSMFMIGINVDSCRFILCLRDVKTVSGSSSVIPSSGIFVRTFGHFDVFVDGMPVVFSSFKEKELLALLIDRNGGTLTSEEGISYLWDIDDPDDKTKAKYRKLAMNLKNTLNKYGIAHILKNFHGTRSIDSSDIICDYYELLNNNESYRSAFHNTYMSGYKWNEATLSILWDYS